MKILVTGGHGFLGKHLVAVLGKDNPLLVPSSKELDVEKYEVLFEYLTATRPDAIIHLAAVCGGIGANQNSPADFFIRNNIMGANILKASHDCGVSKLVTLGSVCSYPKLTPTPFKEEDLWNSYPEATNAPYGIAKKNLLVGCEAFSEQYGSNFIHLIPVNMYGEYDHFDLQSSHVIPALIRKFHEAKTNKTDKVVVWGDGQASREFLYAGDCAEAIHMALHNYNDPAPVNIGTGVEITIKDLVIKIKQIVGFKGEIVYDTSKPNGQPRRCLDTTRARESFGFEAHTPLADGLLKTYDWYLHNVAN